MIVVKTVSARRILAWVWVHILWLSIWASSVVGILHYYDLHDWFSVPWLPISLVGTAVAFFVGFKNNSSYDRLWEARKIWGGIVNSSRTWGITLRSYVSNQFRDHDMSDKELHAIHRRIIRRHIGWLYALRCQLLAVKDWEHAGQRGFIGKTARRYQRDYGVGLIDDQMTDVGLQHLLPEGEFDQLVDRQNLAAQLLDQQSKELQQLRCQDLIDDFRHMELQNILASFFDHQGKAERIKNYPLPRQYANSGSIFIAIFILLLPFGMATEFAKNHSMDIWWSVPFTVLVGWVFVMLETVGDYSENPFQGMANDIPMFSLCRTIEIDLLEMLGEPEIPEPAAAKDGILM